VRQRRRVRPAKQPYGTRLSSVTQRRERDDGFGQAKQPDGPRISSTTQRREKRGVSGQRSSPTGHGSRS